MSKSIISKGIACPLIKEGDSIVDIVVNSIQDETLNDRDVIGVTESVVSRSFGLYISVDDIAEDIKNKFGNNATVILCEPIYSRNRFAMILKGIARGVKKIILVMPDFDEVGNPIHNHPFTSLNYDDEYRKICKEENCECEIFSSLLDCGYEFSIDNFIDCSLHPHENKKYYTLRDICSSQNPDFGVLGSNKATSEKLKLFPTREISEKVCKEIKERILEKTGKNVYVLIFGDGCFHSPEIDEIPGTSINEEADPCSWLSSKEDSILFNSSPNEIKLKNFIDEKFNDLHGEILENAVKNEIKNLTRTDLKGNMAQMGCTPRHYGDLIATNFDTLVGSGSKGCPVCLLQGYFESYEEKI